MSEEIDRIRGYGKRYIPPKTGGGFYAQIQDAKLSKEHAYEMSKKNVCQRCHTVKSKNGECLC